MNLRNPKITGAAVTDGVVLAVVLALVESGSTNASNHIESSGVSGGVHWDRKRIPPEGTTKDYLPIFIPITSPETTISTRRFLCLPSAVELSATGVVSPNPRDVTLASANPC